MRYALFFLFFFATFLWDFSHSGLLEHPPRDHDGMRYDAIARNLLKGQGIRFTLDSETRALYHAFPHSGAAQIIANGSYDRGLESMGTVELTGWFPPLYPIVLAGAYHLSDRNFATYKLVNGLLLSLTGLVGVYFLRMHSGWFSAFIFSLLFMADPSLRSLSKLCLSENLALLLISLSFVELNKYKPASWKNLRVGLLLGLLSLTRHMCALWFGIVPGLLLFIKHCDSPLLSRIKSFFQILTVALFVASPLMVRNINLYESFYPFGTQGSMGLGMVYQDGLVSRNGNCTAETFSKFFERYPGTEQGIEREKALASRGVELAKKWAVQNYNQLIPAAMLRVMSLWWIDTTRLQQFYVLISSVALLFVVNRSIRGAMLTLFLAHTLTIMLTSNINNGRYLLLLQPLFILLTTLTIVAGLNYYRSFRTHDLCE